MAVDTWTLLKSEIADWLNKTSLTSQIPNFIANAESRFNRELTLPEMEESVTATSDDAIVTLPANFLKMRSIYIDGSSDLKLLRQMPIWQLRDTYRTEEADEPEHYALQSANELVFGPAPSASFTYIMNYYEKIPALGASVADNWLLLAHPDLYVSASLVEGYTYLRDAEGVTIQEGRTRQKLDELKRAGLRKGRSETRQRLRTGIPFSTSCNRG